MPEQILEMIRIHGEIKIKYVGMTCFVKLTGRATAAVSADYTTETVYSGKGRKSQVGLIDHLCFTILQIVHRWST